MNDLNNLTDAEKAAAFEGVKQYWMRLGFAHGVRHSAAKALDWANQAESTAQGAGSGYRNLATVIGGIEPPKGL